MIVTFLLGNGFDRVLGLETSYSHFYEEYCTTKSNDEVISEFRKKIFENIKTTPEHEEKLWSDAELGLAKVTSEYSMEQFVMCCEDMHEKLVAYLEKQDKMFSDTDEHFQEIVKLLSSHIVNFQQDLTPKEQKIFAELRSSDKTNDSLVNIITLNYTSTCDKIFSALSQQRLDSWNTNYGVKSMKMGQLVHAHGYIDNFPIFGVCNPDLVEKKEYLTDPAFRALMIKRESIDAVGQTWRDDTFSAIKNSDVICIFGASLGKSDSDYWEYIAEWLKTNSSRRLVIFEFDPNIKKTNISYYQQYTKQKQVKDKFLGFTNYDDETRKNLSERIHIVINATRFFVVKDEWKVKYPTPSKKKEHRSIPVDTYKPSIEDSQRIVEMLAQNDEINATIQQLAAPLQLLNEINPKLLM